MGNTLSSILAGEVIDPRTGQPFDCAIQSIVIEENLSKRAVDLLLTLDFTGQLLILTDRASSEVLGSALEIRLAKHFKILPCRIDGRAHADEEAVARILPLAEKADALVAIGSGSLNDLAKISAARLKKPYAVFATAPSMNGYASRNASIAVKGHKQTLPALPPRGIFIDLKIFAGAPKPMILAGLGDSLARSTAQFDWLLSHLLLETEYQALPFDWLLPLEEKIFSDPKTLFDGDLVAHRALAETLILSGLGMNFANGSYPASQGEHLLAHYMEMQGKEGPALHGQQIALTACHMAFLQEAILNKGEVPRLRPESLEEKDFIAWFGLTAGRQCWKDFQPKLFEGKRLEDINHRLEVFWPRYLTQLEKVHRPPLDMKRIAKAIDAPLQSGAIGWHPDMYREAFHRAGFIRNRFTSLDLLRMAGWLEEGLGGIFA